MIRTIICFIYFFIYLIITLPLLMKVIVLDKQNKIADRDELVYRVAGNWARLLVKLSGSEVKVIGHENVPKDGPVLFVSNHQGNFDIPILIGFIDKPKAFISKIEVRKLPIIRTWMYYMNCIFIKRGDARKALEAINQGVEVLKEGYSLVIFPEGTRSKDGNLGEFKPGSLKLATKSGMPIVPVTIKGSYKIMKKNSFSVHPAYVEIIISPAVSPDIIAAKDSKDLAEMIKNIISNNLYSDAPIFTHDTLEKIPCP
ncbi:MAG: 1-acyl-sn-glycerol-3-phosphate acyltransferase [Petroclostridium sp.]|nr:plsC2 [Clostridia bacterium]MDK2809953.1 1-acyl-sn-glycerol-3-phosphate acyltransferase [Petroclostridium sp.]